MAFVRGAGGFGGGGTPSTGPLPVDTGMAPLPADDAFGLDVSTQTDLDATFTPIGGARAVAEVVARRYETPHGALADDPDFGTDIRGLLNESMDEESLAPWRHAMAVEAMKDERVLDAEVTLVAELRAGSLRALVVLTLAEGPFQLVLNVGRMSVELLRVTAQ